MNIQKRFVSLVVVGAAMLFGGAALADQIEIKAQCSDPSAPGDSATCDTTVIGSYGFEWTVLGSGDPNDGTAAATDTYSVFNVTLENLGPDGSIDAFAFNLDGIHTLVAADSVTGLCGPLSSGQVCFGNISPSDWTITVASGGVQFEYVGSEDPGQPDNRLGAGDKLTFDIHFDPATTYSTFLNSDSDSGKGFGGGSDTGQVCVSFQEIRTADNTDPETGKENDSDLLCGTYEDTPMEMSEPGTLGLLGLGLIGLGLARRRRMAA